MEAYASGLSVAAVGSILHVSDNTLCRGPKPGTVKVLFRGGLEVPIPSVAGAYLGPPRSSRPGGRTERLPTPKVSPQSSVL